MNILKKILNYSLHQIKYFIFNPFWTSWISLTVLAITVILNGFIWYEYIAKFHMMINLTPIGYTSAVLILNLFLANISYPKQNLLSFILLGTALLIQIFFIFFLKITFLAGAY